MRLKPAPWTLDRELIDSDWSEFYDGAQVFHPTWEGVGAPRDVIGTTNGAVGVQPAWIVSDHGRVLSYDEVNDYYTVADTPALTFPDGPWTLLFYLAIPDNSGTAFQYWFSWGAFQATPSIQIFMNESSEPSAPNVITATITDNSGNDVLARSSSVGAFSDFRVLAIRRVSATNLSINLQGVDITASHTVEEAQTSDINRADALNIGRRADGDTARFFGGQISWWAKWPRDIGDDLINRVVSDPLGPIEMMDQVPVQAFGPTAVASGRIMSSLAAAGGLAGKGGLAGQGGGLAG